MVRMCVVAGVIWMLTGCTHDEASRGSLDGGTADAARADASVPVSDRYFAHVPLELDPSTGRESFTAQNIRSDANMVTLHFDFFGIPWAAFATDAALPEAWTREMDRISALVDQMELPVFLALTPLHGTRDKLASEASGLDTLTLNQTFGAPCEDISKRSDAQIVHQGYASYVRYMVDRFAPKFLALSIEVNLYEKACPAVWKPVEKLLNDVYASERARHPELPIFNTLRLEDLWQASESTDPCFGYVTTCLDANMAKFAALQNDILALSTYPLVPARNNQRLPSDWFSAVAERTDIPLAVAETGYQAATIQAALDANTCIDALLSSPDAQKEWVVRLLDEAEALHMPFVTWWSNRDLMPTEISSNCHCADEAEPWCDYLRPLPADLKLLFQFFGSMGLRDVVGQPRASHAVWAAEVGRVRSLSQGD